MKKFLSMVLALVMAVSLVTISSSAAFTDAADIDYKEAVDVMTKVGIVNGYEDGSFGPDGYLSRGAAAKIICNMILGVNNELPSSAAPYSDVAAGSTFAGYIAYCQNEGIINGYADGTFKPGNQLTGFAFMKMLLGALGYDGAIEGYSGNNWAVSVAKDGKAAGLYNGFADDVNFNGAITRQEALQMAFNAMKATMVEYPSNTSIVVGDIKVTTTAEAKKVTTTSTASYNNFDDSYVQFCEANFPKLKVTTTDDSYGRPANKWTYKTALVGTYAKAPTLSYVNDPKLYTVRQDLGLGVNDQPYFYATYSMNSVAYGWFEAADVQCQLVKAVSSDTTTLDSIVVPGTAYFPVYGKGQLIEVYYDAEKTAAGNYSGNEIVIIDETLGKIKTVGKDDTGRYVTVDNAPAGINSKFYTENFAKGDMVVYTTGINKAGDIVSMKAAETITGTISFFNGYTYVVIDGNGYYCHVADWATDMASIGDTVIAYFDSYGYIVGMKVVDSNTDLSNLVLIENTGAANLLGKKQAIAIYGDGKEEVVTLYDADATSLYTVYNFSTVNGTMKTLPVNGYTSAEYNGDMNFEKGQLNIKDGSTNKVVVDNNTAFVFVGDKTNKTYVGYKNAPSFTGAAKVVALKKADKTAAALVYVWTEGATVTNKATDFTMVIGDTYYLWQTTNANGERIAYYAMKTVDGQTLYVDENAVVNGGGSLYSAIYGYQGVGAYVIDEVQYADETGYINWAKPAVSGTDYVNYWSASYSTELKVADGILYVTYYDRTTGVKGYSYTYTYADDAVVYEVAFNGDSSAESSIADLAGDYEGATLILDEDGIVTGIAARMLKG